MLLRLEKEKLLEKKILEETIMYTTYNKLMLVTATLLLTIYTPAQPFFFCSPKMVSKKTVYYSHPYCCFDKKIVYYDTEFDDDGEAYLIKKYSYKPCSACCHKKLYRLFF